MTFLRKLGRAVVDVVGNPYVTPVFIVFAAVVVLSILDTLYNRHP